MATFKEMKKSIADFDDKYIGSARFYKKYIPTSIQNFFSNLVSGIINFIDDGVSLFNYFVKEVFTDEFLARLHDNFAWLSIAGIVIGYMKACLDLYRIFFKPDDKANKTIAVLATIANIVLTVIATCIFAGAFIVSFPIMAVVGSAKATVETLYHLGKAIYDRFFGEGAVAAQRINALKEVLKQRLINGETLDPTDEHVKLLTELINKQRAYNTQIITKLHSLLFINIPTLVGSLFLATGIFAKVGLIIMAVTSAYGGINLVGLNPISLAFNSTCTLSKVLFGRTFFLDIFSKKNENDIIHDLKSEAKRDQSSIPVPSFIRKSSTATAIWQLLHPKSLFNMFKSPVSHMKKTQQEHMHKATKALNNPLPPHLLDHNHSTLFADHQPHHAKPVASPKLQRRPTSQNRH